MEAARLRTTGSLPQRVQDVAERLSTHAKAELYGVLEGIAGPSGEVSSLLPLEPLVNDIVAQLNDSFKQAVTKRLLPEACKLLSSRSGALGSSLPWQSGQPSAGLGSSLLSGTSGPYSLQSSPAHHDNDILAFGLTTHSGQPLRSDQGPPHDMTSEAASSLLMGTPASSAAAAASSLTTPLSPPTSATAGAVALHPMESRFAFANVAGGGGGFVESRRAGSLQRSSLPSGGGSDAATPADALRILGLGGDGASSGLGLGPGLGGVGGGRSGEHFANGSSLSSPADALLPYLGNGSSPAAGAVGDNGGSSGLATPAAPGASLSRGLASLSLSGAASDAALGGGVSLTSVASSPSPHPPAGASPYSSLPLSIRPGSSLDPGLATPPVSLPGTEPIRGGGGGAGGHAAGAGQVAAGPAGRQAGAGAEMALALPVPLFGGAPGPSPSPGGGAHQHLSQLQQQQQQLLLQRQMQAQAQWQAAELEAAVNGNGAHAYLTHQQQAQQQAQHVHPSTAYPAEQQRHQQQGQGVAQAQGPGQGGGGGAYATAQLQLQQQLQQAAGFGGTSAAGALSGRVPLAAAPEGPRPSAAGRPAAPGLQHTGFGAHGQASELPYDGSRLLEAQQQQQHPAGLGALQERYVGARGLGGLESPEYGMYGTMSPLAGGGGGGMLRDAGGASGMGGAQQRSDAFLLGPGVGSGAGLLAPQGYGVAPGASAAAAGVGGRGGSPAMMAAMALPPGGGSPAPGAGAGLGLGLGPVACGAQAEALGRASRSGALSAASAAESRSSSFSTGGGGAVLGGPVPHQSAARRGSGSGSGGAQTPPLTAVQPSPPASDASGPSTCGSASASGPLAGGVGRGSPAPSPGMSMAAKLQQVAAKPMPSPSPSPGTPSRTKPAAQVGPHVGGGGGGTPGSGGGGVKAPADMPGRFRCLPAPVQARIATLTRDNHVVLLKDFDEKVLSKMTLLVDKFGAAECLAMLDRIEEVLKGKAGRLANGPGYLDVSVSTRLDELKQRASGQVTAPEDYARSTLHSRIYAELRDLIARHGFLQWHHFDQGIINMLKKMPNATALERLNELAYHSFKNVDNPKSCIVSIFTTKPKYVNA